MQDEKIKNAYKKRNRMEDNANQANLSKNSSYNMTFLHKCSIVV